MTAENEPVQADSVLIQDGERDLHLELFDKRQVLLRNLAARAKGVLGVTAAPAETLRRVRCGLADKPSDHGTEAGEQQAHADPFPPSSRLAA